MADHGGNRGGQLKSPRFTYRKTTSGEWVVYEMGSAVAKCGYGGQGQVDAMRIALALHRFEKIQDLLSTNATQDLIQAMEAH